jgi:hypothetical protein
MALFKTDPDKAIPATEANLSRLKTELVESQDMVARYRATAMRFAAEGGDADGRKRAQEAMKSAQDSADITAGAIADVESKLAGLVAERDKQLDLKARHAAANDIEQMLRESGDIVRDTEKYFKQLADWCAKVSPNVPEAGGVETLATAMRQQIPEAITLYQKLLGNLASSILAGSTSPKLKVKDVPFVQPAIIAPTRTPLFCIRPIKYVDPDSGKLIAIQQFQDGEFPLEYAKAALDLKVAVRLSDPRRRERHGTIPGHASPGQAFDLDAAMSAPKAAAVDPIKASAAPSAPSIFTVVDRGPAIQLKISR